MGRSGILVQGFTGRATRRWAQRDFHSRSARAFWSRCMSELADLSASELRNLIERRECSCEDIVKSCFSKIRKLEPSVKAFVEYREDSALEQARQRDQSPSTGLLDGIPVAVKDTVDVAGMRCT